MRKIDTALVKKTDQVKNELFPYAFNDDDDNKHNTYKTCWNETIDFQSILVMTSV